MYDYIYKYIIYSKYAEKAKMKGKNKNGIPYFR